MDYKNGLQGRVRRDSGSRSLYPQDTESLCRGADSRNTRGLQLRAFERTCSQIDEVVGSFLRCVTYNEPRSENEESGKAGETGDWSHY